MKLVKPDQFNRPVSARIELPYPSAHIQAMVTVIVLKNNTVELQGHVVDEGVGKAILEAGLQRLTQWHAQQRAAQTALLVGPDGLPLTGPAGKA